MNDPFSGLLDEVAAAMQWDTSAFTAYQHLAADTLRSSQEKQPMQISKETSQFIQTGVRAVSLAVRVAESTPLDSVAHQMALAAIKDWGLEISVPPVAEQDNEPVLLWPPPAPALDPVYQTHKYVVRSDATAKLEPYLGIPQADQADKWTDVTVATGEIFVFTGITVWHPERDCYLMRMAQKPGTTGPLWLFSRDVRVGDEILAAAEAP